MLKQSNIVCNVFRICVAIEFVGVPHAEQKLETLSLFVFDVWVASLFMGAGSHTKTLKTLFLTFVDVQVAILFVGGWREHTNHLNVQRPFEIFVFKIS